MKIAISAVTHDIDADVDARFGRARVFVIYDTDSGEHTSLENTVQMNAVQGAGIQTAQNLANAGVSAVLSGHCGPKAYKTLAAAGIDIYADVTGTVSDAIEAFKSGSLSKASGPDVEGHW